MIRLTVLFWSKQAFAILSILDCSTANLEVIIVFVCDMVLCGVAAVADVGVDNILIVSNEALFGGTFSEFWGEVSFDGGSDFLTGWNWCIFHGDTGASIVVFEEVRVTR